MTPPKILPPHYFLLALMLMGALKLLSGSGLLPSLWPWLGLLPVVVGVLLAAAGSRRFSSAGTNIVPFTEASTLVTQGVFAYSRNPMYLGMILALVGVAVLLNSALPWLVVGVFALLLRFGFVRIEEQLMKASFGDAYADYQSRVRRWL